MSATKSQEAGIGQVMPFPPDRRSAAAFGLLHMAENVWPSYGAELEPLTAHFDFDPLVCVQRPQDSGEGLLGEAVVQTYLLSETTPQCLLPQTVLRQPQFFATSCLSGLESLNFLAQLHDTPYRLGQRRHDWGVFFLRAVSW